MAFLWLYIIDQDYLEILNSYTIQHTVHASFKATAVNRMTDIVEPW